MTTENVEQINQPEESDYLQALHERQTNEPDVAAEHSEPMQPEEDYLQLLHQKQSEALQQKEIPVQAAMVRELPRTASPLPLVGLSGILLLAGSVGLRLCSKRPD